jgi:hypothetical protein
MSFFSIFMKMLRKSFRKNVRFNLFLYTNVVATLFIKNVVQLFMKNVGSTFFLKNVVTFLKNIATFYNQ